MTTLTAKLVSTFGWDKSDNQIFSLIRVADSDKIFKHANFQTIPKKPEKLSTITQHVMDLRDDSDQRTTGSNEQKSNTQNPT